MDKIVFEDGIRDMKHEVKKLIQKLEILEQRFKNTKDFIDEDDEYIDENEDDGMLYFLVWRIKTFSQNFYLKTLVCSEPPKWTTRKCDAMLFTQNDIIKTKKEVAVYCRGSLSLELSS